ncbi:TonB family protein [Acidobacteriota bacterium]
MKFRIAVVVSVILHISIFALAFYVPGIPGLNKEETVYYVDFLQMPGGGGGGSGGSGEESTQAIIREDAADTVEIQDTSKGVKDLTVKKAEINDRLRHPDLNKKKQKDDKKSQKSQKKKKKEELVSIIRKDKRDMKRTQNMPSSSNRTGSNIRIGTGTGSGSGGGTGSGFGSGSGSGYGGSFPYAYYIDTIKNKISSSWYSSLVSPGLRGKFVVVVYFKILRNGSIEDLTVERKSGSDSLDLSALRAVENASPFPPLPVSFAYRYLGVHFEFEWSK